MVDEISPNNVSKNEQLLIAAINQSLDKSLNDIDEFNLQGLKRARAKALNYSPNVKTKKSKWVQLSMVASLAALVLIPVVLHQQSINSTEPDLEIVSQEMPISAEEMDDIDMLIELEDTDA